MLGLGSDPGYPGLVGAGVCVIMPGDVAAGVNCEFGVIVAVAVPLPGAVCVPVAPAPGVAVGVKPGNLVSVGNKPSVVAVGEKDGG